MLSKVFQFIFQFMLVSLGGDGNSADSGKWERFIRPNPFINDLHKDANVAPILIYCFGGYKLPLIFIWCIFFSTTLLKGFVCYSRLFDFNISLPNVRYFSYISINKLRELISTALTPDKEFFIFKFVKIIYLLYIHHFGFYMLLHYETR